MKKTKITIAITIDRKLSNIIDEIISKRVM